MEENQGRILSKTIEEAIEEYLLGKKTLEESAELSTLSLEEFIEILEDRDIEIPEIEADNLFDIDREEEREDTRNDDIENEDNRIDVIEEVPQNYSIENPTQISEIEFNDANDGLREIEEDYIVKEEPVVIHPTSTAYYEEKEVVPWYASKWLLIAASIAGLVLAILLGWVLLSLFGGNREIPSAVPIDNEPVSEIYTYNGKTIEEGRRYAESKGYQIVVVEQYSNTVKKGDIIDSLLDTSDGKEVLTLYVSMGAENVVNGNTNNNENNSSNDNNSQNNSNENNSNSNQNAVMKVTIPSSLKGMKEADAISELKNAGLSVTTQYKYDNFSEEGTVIQTLPSIGTFVEEKTNVTMTVSKGKPSVNNNKGKDVSVLQNEVKKLNEEGANITVKINVVKSDTTKNTILSQDKDGKVSLNSVINVDTSSGEDLSKVNFIGKSFDELKKWANNHGYSIDYTEEYSDSVSSGNITSQSPTNFEGYTGKITAKVSRGSYNLPINSLTGRHKSELEKEINLANSYNAGLKVNYTEEYSSSVPNGNIISINQNGKNITATVSKGEDVYIVASQVGRTVQQVQNSELCQKLNCSFVREGDSEDLKPGETKITSHNTGTFKKGDSITFKYLRGVKEK